MRLIALFTLLLPLISFAQIFEGKASYYADKLHGNETASGEKYDKFAFTAAHRTLPFGTWVRVTNLWNGKSVEVKINDRGPFGNDGRVIDVSKQAALDLQMITAGVVDVKVEVIDKSAPTTPIEKTTEKDERSINTNNEKGVRGDNTYKINVKPTDGLLGYGVQVGSYADFMAVIEKLNELESKGFPDLYINTAEVNNKRVFRIVAGNFESRAEAELFLVSVKSKGIDAYVVAHQK